MIRRLLASYPSTAHDPETYSANLVELLVKYPRWAGEKACMLARRSTSFLPTEAELYKHLEDHVRVHRSAQEWDRNAAKMVEERKLLTGPKPAPRLTGEEIAERYGPNFGLGAEDEEMLMRFRSRQRELASESERFAIREYEQAGFEPAYSPDGTLISLALLRLLHGNPRERVGR